MSNRNPDPRKNPERDADQDGRPLGIATPKPFRLAEPTKRQRDALAFLARCTAFPELSLWEQPAGAVLVPASLWIAETTDLGEDAWNGLARLWIAGNYRPRVLAGAIQTVEKEAGVRLDPALIHLRPLDVCGSFVSQN